MSAELIRPTVYQFRLGEALVTALLDGYVARSDLHPFTATNAAAAEVEAVARAHHLPFPASEHSFTGALIALGDQLTAIDPGFGAAAPFPTAGQWLSGLKTAGYGPEQVTRVLISHCHPDHIGNLITDGAPTFPNADIVIGRTEYDYWRRGENISEMRKPTLALFQKIQPVIEDRLRLIEPGETAAPGVLAVEAFGHSAGHLVFTLESAGKRLTFLNDTVAHVAVSFARPDWRFAMDDDAEKAAVTRRRILERAAADGAPVCGFHLPFPAVGFVERSGEGFRFVPAGYALNLG